MECVKCNKDIHSTTGSIKDDEPVWVMHSIIVHGGIE